MTPERLAAMDKTLAQHGNLNSALVWFPPIQAAGLPVPRTVFVPYSHDACLAIFDGDASEEFSRLVKASREKCAGLGYPVFCRTDLSSAKHSGPDGYLITDEDSVGRVVGGTIEDNEMKFWTERVGPKAIMLREFLTLKSAFTAFSGLPISREFRFFADDSRVLCWHPYWPEEALEGHVRGCPDWRDKLRELQSMSDDALADLSSMAVRAAQAVGYGQWSVDFFEDCGGRWWLSDMATMKDSYHFPGCSTSPEARHADAGRPV